MRLRSVLAAILLVGLLLPARAASNLDLTADFVSDYIFRGRNTRQGTSIQSTLSYNLYDTVTASLWTNLRLEGGLGLSETDYNVQWTYLTSTRAQLTLGGIYYDRNSLSIGRETSEVYGSVQLNVPAKPRLTLYYDWLHNPGLYAEGELSHRILLPNYKGTVDLSAGLGFDSGRINGFQTGRVSLGFTRLFGDWKLTPAVDLFFPARDVDPFAHNFRPVFRFSASRSF